MPLGSAAWVDRPLNDAEPFVVKQQMSRSDAESAAAVLRISDRFWKFVCHNTNTGHFAAFRSRTRLHAGDSRLAAASRLRARARARAGSYGALPRCDAAVESSYHTHQARWLTWYARYRIAGQRDPIGLARGPLRHRVLVRDGYRFAWESASSPGPRYEPMDGRHGAQGLRVLVLPLRHEHKSSQPSRQLPHGRQGGADGPSTGIARFTRKRERVPPLQDGGQAAVAFLNRTLLGVPIPPLTIEIGV